MKTFNTDSLCVAATSLFVACGSAWGASSSATHSVGGAITGLTGTGLVLRLNGEGGDAFNVSPPSGAVRFAFTAGLATGSAYAVTVQTQPVGLRQHCTVTQGQAGRIGSADISDVMVTCSSTGTANVPRPTLKSLAGRAWDVYVDAFDVKVDIKNLSYSQENDCTISGGTVNSTFRVSPSVQGKPVGRIQFDEERPVSLAIEFDVDSDATVGPQHGQSSGVPKTCKGSSEHFKDHAYRMVGELPPSSSATAGIVTMTSPMPENGDTTGNAGCPGGEDSGNQCYVRYWFDNSPGTARTTIDLGLLLIGGTVDVPIRGSATNVAGYRETRSGDYTWSGTMQMRAVEIGH